MKRMRTAVCCLFLVNLLTANAAQTLLYVSSESQLPCSFEPCDTLENYASNAAEYFTSNVTVVFLSGVHRLTRKIQLTDVENFALVQESSAVNTTISCSNDSGIILFYNSTNVTVNNLTFVGCGLSENDFDVGAVHFENIVHLSIVNVAVRDSQYHGLRLTNILGSSVVQNIVIEQDESDGVPLFKIVYQHFPSSNHFQQLPTSNQLHIRECRLLRAASLTVDLEPIGYSVDISITTFTAVHIHGNSQPPLRVTTSTPERASLTVRDCNIVDSDTTGVSVYDQGSPLTTVRIVNCIVSEHRAGGVYLQFYQPAPTEPTLEIIVENAVVSSNAFAVTGLGSGLTVQYSGEGAVYEQRPVVFRNVSFSNNVFTASTQEFPAIVHLGRAVNVTFIDCLFTRNLATALRAYLSVFTIAGNLTMSHNFAFRGGAVALFGASYMVVENNSRLLFYNNSVSHVGGAIFVANYFTLLLTRTISCFMRIPVLEDALTFPGNLQVTLEFVDNVAANGGNAIYGAQLHDCTLGNFFYGYQLVTGDLPIARFAPGNDLSLISSDAQRVCVCNDEARLLPDCFAIFLNETRYPGESFTISAVVVGDNFGTITGSVFARFLPREGRDQPSLAALQSTQLVQQQECVDLRYTVQSRNSLEILTLSATGAPVLKYGQQDTVDVAIDIYKSNGRILTDLILSPVYINVTLVPCPLGFVLTEDNVCGCDPTLVENDITCNISDQTIRRDGTTWVGVSYAGNESDGVIVYLYCPYGYCVDEEQDVNLEEPDTQCALNHAGVLCGHCETGTSLTLGTLHCRTCTNSYLALLIPFALAGIALVLLIKLLNLTVSKGTINGLIFYANVIQASNADFFPGQNRLVFIAWLNLDLGIETCFFDGLDGYIQTWLQFVFPVYIWVIALFVILASRRSTTIAKIFGGNSVPMLATLFHLSYAKLLRTIITSLSVTVLDYPDGSKRAVWTFDGNVDYINSKHAPLFLFALAILFLLWLPYTGLLLVSQWLAKVQNRRISRWYNRTKPFLDAYFGPFKDKHRYWVGVLLLARCILFLGFAINPASTPSVDLLLIVIVTSLLLTYVACTHGLYKKSYKTWLENSFLLNLLLLSAGKLYAVEDSGAETLSYVSVATAFVEFLLIVAFHVYSYTYGRTLLLVLWERLTRGKEAAYPGVRDENDDSLLVSASYTHQTVSLSELREPMLEETD